jgi:F-type H+-transporting ATPase subunit b
MPPGMRPPTRQPPPPPAEPEHKQVEHCPGHGPTDPPGHINLWHGLIGVNNDKAGSPKASVVDRLLWRYENHNDPCDKKNEPPPLLANVINFGVLVFLLVRFGRKPIAEALVKRRDAIMGEIDNATRLKDEARARLREYKKKAENIDETLEELKAEYALQSEQEKKRILAEAEERRDRMRRDAEFRIEQERKAARLALIDESVQQAVAAAEELLKTRIEAGDHDRAAEDYLAGIAVAVRGDGSHGGATRRAPTPGPAGGGA